MFAVKVEIPVTLKTISDNLIAAFEGGSNYWYACLDYSKKKIPDMNFIKENFEGFSDEDKKFRHMYWPLGGEMLVTIQEEIYSDKSKVKPVGTENISGQECEIYALNLERIKKGLEIMAKESPQHFQDLVTETGDAITGDVFLQYCLFEELVFS